MQIAEFSHSLFCELAGSASCRPSRPHPPSRVRCFLVLSQSGPRNAAPLSESVFWGLGELNLTTVPSLYPALCCCSCFHHIVELPVQRVPMVLSDRAVSPHVPRPPHLVSGRWPLALPPVGGWALAFHGPVENRLTPFDSPVCQLHPVKVLVFLYLCTSAFKQVR